MTAPSRVRFGGAENSSSRSAWTTLSQSLHPPAMAQRQATLENESLDKAMRDAALVADLYAEADSESFSYNTSDEFSEDKVVTHVLPITLKQRQQHPAVAPKEFPRLQSILKRSNTVPMMSKVRIEVPDQATRSAWGTTEARKSLGSMFGPFPVQRQKSKSIFAKDECASIAEMAHEL